MGKTSELKGSWRIDWAEVDRILENFALPKLGKIDGGKAGEALALRAISRIAESYYWSRVDDGQIKDVRKILGRTAKAAKELAEALHLATPGVFEALSGAGLNSPPPWIDALREAGDLRRPALLIFGKNDDLEEVPPGIQERAKALGRAASEAHASLLHDARKGGFRDWHEYRQGSPKLVLMRECLLFLVDRGLTLERRLKPLARAIYWAVEGEDPGIWWGQKEYELTKAWWERVRPYYGTPHSAWPKDINTLYQRGPVALRNGSSKN